MADNKIEGTSLWGWTIALSGFVIAVLGTFFGQLADKRKRTSRVLSVLDPLLSILD